MNLHFLRALCELCGKNSLSITLNARGSPNPGIQDISSQSKIIGTLDPSKSPWTAPSNRTT
jgi:hypothetical protein